MHWGSWSFLGNDVSVPIRAYNATEDDRVKYEAAYNNMSDWVDRENLGDSSNVYETTIKIDDYDVNVKK